jgi:hypothetical protein
MFIQQSRVANQVSNEDKNSMVSIILFVWDDSSSKEELLEIDDILAISAFESKLL